MDFLWPDLLLLLGLIPLVAALYIWRLRQRCRFAVRYSSLALVREAIPDAFRWRRHLPFVLFTAALASLVAALGRPVVPREMLSGQTTIVLALDTSRSMCMRDILPSRMDAARAAAFSFIEQPVAGTQVGIVAFSGFAEVAQEPTTDLHLLESAIANLTTATQTAIGSAILRSLDAIAKVDKRVAPSQEIDRLAVFQPEEGPQQISPHKKYVPHIIVLLTDGENNTGPSPLLAAQQASERGVRIFSIGFGTTRNVVMDCWSIPGSEPPARSGPGPQAGSGSFGSGADEATLKQIAEMTGGQFYSATNADELHGVFQSLHSYVAMTNKKVEVSAFFTAAAALLGVLAMVISFLWHPLL